MKAIQRLAFASAIFCVSSNPVMADQFGDFTYEVMGFGPSAYIAITDYPDTAVGPVIIPSTIEGMPVKVIDAAAFNEVAGLTTVTIPSSVTTIGSDAFALCPLLTGVSIPASVTSIGVSAFYECPMLTNLVIPSSVTSIGEQAFFHCTGLTSLTIPAGVTVIESKLCEGCTGLSRVTIAGNVTTVRNDSFTGCHGLTSITLPASVESIENYAFFDCIGLKSVTIPSLVTAIGTSAFGDCDELDTVFFMGKAPSMGDTVFDSQAVNPDLRIYFFDGKSGFTAPAWLPVENQPAYASINMGAENPVTPWLILNNLPLDSNLQDDPNQDGVNLLMAYALNLDPNKNLAGSLPKPILGNNQMSMSYYSGTPGISYTVLTSTDLVHWTTNGVTVSAPDANQIRTATVTTGSSSRFMSLKVED